jgi:hypothetical protein
VLSLTLACDSDSTWPKVSPSTAQFTVGAASPDASPAVLIGANAVGYFGAAHQPVPRAQTLAVPTNPSLGPSAAGAIPHVLSCCVATVTDL